MMKRLEYIIVFSLLLLSFGVFANVNVRFNSQRVNDSLEVKILLSSSNAIGLGTSSFVFDDNNKNLDLSKAVLLSKGALGQFVDSGIYSSLSLHEVKNGLHLLLLEAIGNTEVGLFVDQEEVVAAIIQIPVINVCDDVGLKWETNIGAQLSIAGEDIGQNISFVDSGEENFAKEPVLAHLSLEKNVISSSEKGLWYKNEELISNVKSSVFEVFENGTYYIKTSGECSSLKSSSVDVSSYGTSELINSLSIYPNPANSKSEIEYKLANKGKVIVEVYDIVGNKIQSLDKGILTQGVYSEPFSVLNIDRDGIYIVKLQVGEDLLTERVVKSGN